MTNIHTQKSTQRRKIVFLLAVLVMALTIPSSEVPGSMSAGQDLEQSRGSKGQDPVQKYLDISVLPMSKRKAEFRKASPRGRSDLWRIHFSVYLAKHPELNEGQKQVILEGMALVTPELFEAPLSNPDEKATFKQFKAHIHEVFPGDQAAEIFATLGGPEPPISGSNPESSAASKRANQVGVSRANALSPVTSRFTSRNVAVRGECSCALKSDYCSDGTHCLGLWCVGDDSGCGTFWMYACNGTCQPNGELNE